MKIPSTLGLIIILAASALSGCGGGGGGGGSSTQPTRANVFIAVDQPITDLSGLEFELSSTAGANFDNTGQQIVAINAALGSSVVGNFDAISGRNRIILINGSAAGINSGTTPIIRVTYAVAPGAGSPTFSIVSQGTFSAIAPNLGPTTPPVTAANLVVTVAYE